MRELLRSGFVALLGAIVVLAVFGGSEAGAAGVSLATPAAAHAVPAVRARPMRVAVVLMRLPGSTAEPVTTPSVEASTFGATKSVANWFSQMSGGQVAVTGTVFGYYPGVASCDLTTQLAAAAAAAAAHGYVASSYDNLVVYTPAQACGFAGMAWVGSSGVFLNGTVSPGIIEHELGHNLGLAHAGAYECGTLSMSASCLVDYADPTDVMGDPYLNRGYSAEHKYALGWIPASEVRTVTTGTQTIALTASENPLVPGSTELVQVVAPNGTIYAIDRRASVGYDTGLSGVWLRQVAAVKSDDTELVRRTALGAGESFTDAAGDVTIETLTDAGPTASIRVCTGTCAPIVSIQSTKPPVPTPSAASIAASITGRNIATGARSSSRNSSLTLTVPAKHGVAAGHTAVVTTYAGAGGGRVSCRDSRGNVYSIDLDTVGGRRLVICSAHIVGALIAGATITITYPAFDGAAVASANNFSGLRATTRVDRRSTRAGTGRSITSGAAAMTTRAVEVVFGAEVHRGAATLTPGTGSKRVGAIVAFAGTARVTLTPEFEVVVAKGEYRMRGTLSSGAQWRAGMVTYFTS